MRLAFEKNDMLTATKEYEIATSLFPQDAEISFWYAVLLVNKGRTADGQQRGGQGSDEMRSWMSATKSMSGAGSVSGAFCRGVGRP